MFFSLLALIACAVSTPGGTVQELPSSNPAPDPTIAAQSWYPDGDGDGFGDINADAIVASAISDGEAAHVTNNLDCDDANPLRNPGMNEVCNDLDDNCDDVADNAATDQPFWYMDFDGDGFGDGNVSMQSCDGLSHFVNDGTDCDDAAPTINSGAPESCNDVDDDCDGSVDEEPAIGTTYYIDSDGDGGGDAAEDAERIVACERPGLEYVPGHTDCDDSDPEINSGADEFCDGVDNDCDGEVDNRAVDAATWYGDFDGDGFGDMYGWYFPSVRSCEQPAGYIADGSDCEDGYEEVNPDAAEICDWLDNDCDGFTDADDPEGVADASMWFPDMDGDSFGDEAAGTWTCEFNAWMSSGGWNVTVDGSDCDDTRLTVPGFDSDRDGYNWCNGECDDYSWRVSPSATETNNGYDDDCDGAVDEAG